MVRSDDSRRCNAEVQLGLTETMSDSDELAGDNALDATEFIVRPAPPTTLGPQSPPPPPPPPTTGPQAAYQPTMARPMPPAGAGYFGPPSGPHSGMPPVMPPGYPSGGFPIRPPGSTPPRRRRALPWILTAVALVCVAGLVAGGLVWWTTRHDDSSRAAPLDGQLTGTFPTAPTAKWQVGASQLGGEQFVSPDPNKAQYLSLGAVHDEHTLVTFVSSQSSSGRTLAGVDTETGKHWTSSRTVQGCSDTIVNGRIACYDQSTITFFDTATGSVVATADNPSPQAYEIALNTDGAYLRSFTDGGLSIIKLDNSAHTVRTKYYPLADGGPGGDASSFTATSSLVASGQTSVLVVSAADGRELLNRAGYATTEPLADGSIAVISASGSAGSFTPGPVVVVRPDGTTVEIPGASVSVPTVASPNQRGHLLVDGKWTSVADKSSTWTTAVGGPDSPYGSTAAVLADDREVVIAQGENLTVADTVTGQTRWTQKVASSYATGFPVTDGQRLIAADPTGGITALSLADGSNAWSLPVSAVGGASSGSSPAAQTFAVGSTLVTLTGTTITGFAPTGGPAGPPGIAPAQTQTAAGGTVTHCVTAPTFTPQQFRTTPAGLVATMKVVATCADGDVMSGTGTRISIADSGSLVASGRFDFSRAPAAIPPSDVGEGITMELTYPPGSFYRTPDTLGQANGTVAGTFTVDCDPGPQTTTSLPKPEGGSAAPPQVSTGPALPPGVDLGSTTGDALRRQVNSDRAFILSTLNNRWVAQLSSKRPGLFADGKTWDNQAILDEFLALRLRFNDVRLLYSDEWSVFSQPGWWVTVAAATFPGPDQANAWCAAQGFDGEHCFAKLVSTTAPPDGSTRYR